MKHPRCRTVAFEVSSQNVPVCLTLLALTYDPAQLSMVVLTALLYGLISLINNSVFCVAYRIYSWRWGTSTGQEIEFSVVPDTDHKQQVNSILKTGEDDTGRQLIP